MASGTIRGPPILLVDLAGSELSVTVVLGAQQPLLKTGHLQ